MSAVTDQEGDQLSIFPLPSRATAAFVAEGNVWFGWTEKRFELTRNSLTRSKRLHEAPLTEEGWQQILAVMRVNHPLLAAKASDRIRDLEVTKALAARSAAVTKALAARSAAVTKALAARSAADQEELRSSLVAEVSSCHLLGGYGWDDSSLVPGVPCTLSFTAREIWVRPPHLFTPMLRRPYKRALALEFSGPGRQTTGGSFWGGGFGLGGAVRGMIVASVLNALTARTTIHTVLRYQEHELEAFFFCSSATPEELRIRLARIVGSIGHEDAAIALPSVTDELQKLGIMYERGLLTTEEFQELKRKLISELPTPPAGPADGSLPSYPD